MRISDWSSDVCSSDLAAADIAGQIGGAEIGGIAGIEPVMLDQHRDQRRVAEAGDADADQQRAEAGEGIAPESGSHGGGLLGQGKRERRGMLEHRSEEHTSELQSLMRNSYAVFCLKKKRQYCMAQYDRENTETKNI